MPGSQLSDITEMKLALRIMKLQRTGLASSKRVVQCLASQIATALKRKKISFEETAGKNCFQNFLWRNSTLEYSKRIIIN